MVSPPQPTLFFFLDNRLGEQPINNGFQDRVASDTEATPGVAIAALASASFQNGAKVQPWKAFMEEPEIRPFPDEGKAAGTLRLKSEKDEHGLGG
ncbi:hypothetical protein QBC42DRAFT_272417 [Cladorrhinum samala]|uniref:Uncharacterized protein n=1 Tax=Cladorrhinum samala TaxID=585594 RepID=A0AAV9HKV9_9PEZI|nr:hypothetical protein QBC42DRAFT_272417 [Cladorrhinum samala]